MKMAEKIEPIKPKLEELIPFIGLREYSDRCIEERVRRYNCFILNPEIEGDYYMMGILLWNTLVGGAVGGYILGLASVGIEYIAR